MDKVVGIPHIAETIFENVETDDLSSDSVPKSVTKLEDYRWKGLGQPLERKTQGGLFHGQSRTCENTPRKSAQWRNQSVKRTWWECLYTNLQIWDWWAHWSCQTTTIYHFTYRHWYGVVGNGRCCTSDIWLIWWLWWASLQRQTRGPFPTRTSNA